VNAIGELVEEGADVVFCAGNCGQFSASPRCTADDRGQGRSIWGANAHPDVVTVGAVSVAAGWIGYSSEGPAIWRYGPAERQLEKPDLVAPSHFAEDDDPALINSGTSAATALVAGAIAALRSEQSGCRELSPAEMRQALIENALGSGRGWDRRMGHGIINIAPLCTAH
jgi:subtilisin family serine protease